ncbi:SRPBCC domain-containing protein [Methanosarcina hadiensis]|uniref:SRPBCC family protein n=1 Tax=Methanosarcina hadiensis TaxID=3078083 RepID=UPI00397795AB
MASIFYIAASVAVNRSVTRKEICSEIIVNASAFRVWQVLTDFEAYQQWNPFIRKVDGVARHGSRISAQMHLGNHTMTFRPAVLTVKPDRELRWIGHLFIPGIFDGEHSFIIEPLNENQVLLVQREGFNGILVPLFTSVLKDTEKSFNDMNRALKQRVEQTN